MSSLTKLSISEAIKKLSKRECSAVEIAEAHIKQIDSISHLNAIVTDTREHTLSQAKISDEKYANGSERLLEGVPIAIKDLFCTKGIRTTASSKMLNNYIPQYESTVTNKLLNESGAVICGKTNLDEFAMGSSTITSAFGVTYNPWKSNKESDYNRVPGGSSGGSAAIIAAYGAMGSLGTDTGGSIRQPASFCGVSGLKPSYGRCSRYGVISFASSLDCPGPMARTVEDAAYIIQAIAGYDNRDATSVNIGVQDYLSNLKSGVKGMRIGIPKEYEIDGISREARSLWDKGCEWLKDAGAEIVSISLPHTKYGLPVYYAIAPAEASSNLARYDGVRYGHRSEKSGSLEEMYCNTRSEGFGKEVKRRIMIGTFVLSSESFDEYFIKAQKVRRCIYNDFVNAFNTVDAILTPTTPEAAFRADSPPNDPIKMYLCDVFNVMASLAGMPAMSVPAGLSDDGLPIGLQIIGPYMKEDLVLRVGYTIENAASFF
jgi:aspartyl-tRNA(Asn)/glutamyl-tRNA(Gln) amidotransferase subunit A